MERIRIGVLGAGVMGCGVAQVAAGAGHRVVLVDISPERLQRAEQEIRRGLRFQGILGGGEAAEDPVAVLARIRRTTDDGALRQVQFVLENVTESVEAKRHAFGRLDATCPPACIFASNTSAIPIARLASFTARPDRVIGVHFMNPAPLTATVEVVRGEHTSDQTLHRTVELLASMGREAVVVGDAPGFVSNRVLMLTLNEAVFLVQEGVAAAPEVDRIFRRCFGHKMGPLETADMIGLDTVLASLEVLRDALREEKFEPCPLLRRMVGAGRLGRKSGEGFYRYPSPAVAPGEAP